MPPRVTYRRGTPEDSAALTEITVRAKASHGYDEAFMNLILDDMAISEEQIARDTFMLAIVHRRILGYAHLMPVEAPDTVYLENLYIDPDGQGMGLGRSLFEWAWVEAGRRGYDWLEWDSDPNAAPFYWKMGGEQISEVESTTFPGRMIPKFRKPTKREL